MLDYHAKLCKWEVYGESFTNENTTMYYHSLPAHVAADVFHDVLLEQRLNLSVDVTTLHHQALVTYEHMEW
jgi:hypothetical protein